MLSIGIVWNAAQQFSDDIIEDMKKMVCVLETFEMDLSDNYFDFVKKIYLSENMEQWKIEKKILHMKTQTNEKISVIFFEFDESKMHYHPYKKKNVYSCLEECKTFIREKYKVLIDNYTFDIVFHSTDNLQELKNCYDLIKEYLLEESKNYNDKKFVRVMKYEKQILGEKL